MKSHAQERGGVVSFIIITLALAGLLAGGLYLSKHQARVARDTGSSTATVSEPETSGETGTAESGNETSAGSDTSSSTSQTPAAGTGHTSSVATTGPSTVAASGPTDVLVTTIGLMVLTATVYTFVASRRSLVRSALSN